MYDEKAWIFVAAVVALSGCAPLHPSDCHKTSALGSCDSGRFSDEDEYGQQARGSKKPSSRNLLTATRGGEKVPPAFRIRPDGTLEKMNTAEGNKAYCAALREAAKVRPSRRLLTIKSTRPLLNRGLI